MSLVICHCVYLFSANYTKYANIQLWKENSFFKAIFLLSVYNLIENVEGVIRQRIKFLRNRITNAS